MGAGGGGGWVGVKVSYSDGFSDPVLKHYQEREGMLRVAGGWMLGGGWLESILVGGCWWPVERGASSMGPQAGRDVRPISGPDCQGYLVLPLGIQGDLVGVGT